MTDVSGGDAPLKSGDVRSGGLQTTKPGRMWLIKSLGIILALVAFGGWALYDATIRYPNRGAMYAEYAEFQYLRTLEESGRLRSAPIREPRATYEELAQKLKDTGELTSTEQIRHEWLKALSIIGALNEQGVEAVNNDARARLAELAAEAPQRGAPKPLSKFDLRSQWFILAVCWGIAAWLLFIFVPALLRKYKWDPGAKRLHLPGGATLEPRDIDEFDKRKWDKFLIFLQIRDGHETLGGQELKLDLYRHDPLESWILEMERIAFPESAAESAGQEASDDEADEPAPAESSA